MSDIFLSYAKEDRERAGRLAAALRELGWSVFWDREIPAGRSWRQYLGKVLDDAGCVVAAWSNASIGSDWVIQEAEEGLRRDVYVPVLLEDVLPPLGFRHVQAVDLSTGEADSNALQRLVAALSRLLGSPPEARWAEDRAAEISPASAEARREISGGTKVREDEIARPLALAWGEPPEGEHLTIRWLNRAERPIENVATNVVDLRYWHDGRFHWDNKPKEVYWSATRVVNPHRLEDQPDQPAVIHRGETFELKRYKTPSEEVSRSVPGLWAVTIRVEADGLSFETDLFFSWDPKRSQPLRTENDPREPTRALRGPRESASTETEGEDAHSSAHRHSSESPLSEEIPSSTQDKILEILLDQPREFRAIRRQLYEVHGSATGPPGVRSALEGLMLAGLVEREGGRIYRLTDRGYRAVVDAARMEVDRAIREFAGRTPIPEPHRRTSPKLIEEFARRNLFPDSTLHLFRQFTDDSRSATAGSNLAEHRRHIEQLRRDAKKLATILRTAKAPQEPR